IPGLGPILPATARDLLDQADTIGQTAVGPDGQVIAVSDPIRTPRPAPDPCPLERPLPVDPIRAARLALLAAAPFVRELAYSGYRIPPRLRRFLEARDRTCVFPGCNRQARRTDKDHRRPWPLGPTSADNLDCLCRHHHRAKHTVFTVLRDTDGTYIWITRGGWQFLRQPKGF
ncbi:MAG: HNH endonuclease, partial [Frankiaceae bacterium]|nr:HNH endonuclease [Frankiaceae bacterium]